MSTYKSTTLFAHNFQNIVTLKPVQIKYGSVQETVNLIMQEEGMKGFFSGLKMRMIIQSMSSAMAWGTYQIIKSVLGKRSL
jgi:hypothetical protein